MILSLVLGKISVGELGAKQIYAFGHKTRTSLFLKNISQQIFGDGVSVTVL